MFQFHQITFDKLTKKQLYQILQLRNEVFIIEQNAPYQDLDNKDEKATHFLCFDEEKLVAYGRVLFDKDKHSMSLGRLVCKTSHRKLGIAKTLMTKMLYLLDNEYAKQTITISAQTYLEKFYQSFGFISVGSHYLEDGLPHVEMIRTVKVNNS